MKVALDDRHWEGERLVVGRDEACAIHLDDEAVAPRHAYLRELPGGGVLLTQLHEGTNTAVDGVEVEAALLSGATRVRFGSTNLVVHPDVRPAQAPLRPAVLPPEPASASVIERMRLRRSVRAATALAGATLLALVVAISLLAGGVLESPDPDQRVEEVVAKVAPSTVLVQAEREGARASNGSGWILDAERGLIVTNAHVVNSGATFSVGVAGRLRRAEVAAVAPCEDLAVLRLSAPPAGLRELPLGRQDQLRQGQTVVAVGFPGNASQSDALTSTTGVVSVVRSRYREPALDVPAYANVVQTDAAINPGNSGGPLVDLEGRLVGVNSAGRTASDEGRIIEGQAYAIGVDRVREVLPGLAAGRSSGWIGAGFDHPTVAELERRKLPPGLIVRSVVRGSAADRAGLGREPSLLVSVGGRRISNTLLSYCDAVSGLPAGPTPVEVVDPRTRDARTVTVQLP